MTKRATNHRALWRKITYKNKASYGSSPHCNNITISKKESHNKKTIQNNTSSYEKIPKCDHPNVLDYKIRPSQGRVLKQTMKTKKQTVEIEKYDHPNVLDQKVRSSQDRVLKQTIKMKIKQNDEDEGSKIRPSRGSIV